MAKTDVLLIGSGISALTCAVILAKKGKSVRVLEQYNKPGGYMHCFSRFGRRFDTGAHYAGALDPGQPFHALLSYLGVYDPELFVPLDPDGFDVLRFPDFETRIPKGYPETIARLSDQFPSEAGAITAYFTKIRDVVMHFPTYEYSEEVDFDITRTALETPLSEVVEGLTKNPLLQCVFYSYCTLHGVKPRDVAFGLHALVTDSLIRGAYGFSRGGDALAQKYVEVIERHGGEVLLKKRVERIENTGRLAQAVVCAGGERFEAEWIISGIHPRATADLVQDPSVFSPAYRGRLAAIEETMGIFGIYAACAHAPDLSPLRNYYYFSSQDPARILDPNADAPPTVFVSPASRKPQAGGQAPFEPEFGLNIHAAGPIEWFTSWDRSVWNKRPAEYGDAKQLMAERVFSAIGRHDPAVPASIRKFATSTALTNLHFNGSPGGSPYGLYHSISNTGARALGPRTHVANLLLTGQSCLFPGLMGAAVSALRTAGHVVGIKPILKELRELRQA